MNSAMVKQEQTPLAAHPNVADDEDEILKENGVGEPRTDVSAVTDDLLNDADSGNDNADTKKDSQSRRVGHSNELPAASVGAVLEQLRKQQLERPDAHALSNTTQSDGPDALGTRNDGFRKRKRAQSESEQMNAQVKTAKRHDCDALATARVRRSSSALLDLFERRLRPASDPPAHHHRANHSAAQVSSAPSTEPAVQHHPAVRENGPQKAAEAPRPEQKPPASSASSLAPRTSTSTIVSSKPPAQSPATNSLIAQQQLITSILRQQQQHMLLSQLGLQTIPLNNGVSLPAQVQLQQQLAQIAAFQQQQQQAVAAIQQAAAIQQQQRIAQAQAQQLAAIHQLQAQAQQAAQFQAHQQQAAAQAQAMQVALQMQQQQQAQLAALAQMGFNFQNNSFGSVQSQNNFTGLGLLAAGHNVNNLPSQGLNSQGVNTLNGFNSQNSLAHGSSNIAGLPALVQSAGNPQSATSQQLALLQQQAVAQATAQQLFAQAQQASQHSQSSHSNSANMNVSQAHAALGYGFAPGSAANQGGGASQLANASNANALMQLGLLGQAGQAQQAQAALIAAAQSGQNADLGQLVLGPNGQLMRLVKPTNPAAPLRM